MGFNRRKLEDQRPEAANKEAANRRATDAQVIEDAERLIAACWGAGHFFGVFRCDHTGRSNAFHTVATTTAKPAVQNTAAIHHRRLSPTAPSVSLAGGTSEMLAGW